MTPAPALDRIGAAMEAGDRFRARGEWEAAAEAYTGVLAQDSWRDDARIALGDCLLHLDRLEEALGEFERAWAGSASRPDSEWAAVNVRRALFGKAVTLQLLKNYAKAESVYQSLLALDPTCREALSNLVAMSIEENDLERCAHYSGRLLNLDGQSIVARQGLAEAALDAGDWESAERLCLEILDRDSECFEARHNWRLAREQRARRKA